MLWFEYYFNLLRFFLFLLYWCAELILPLAAVKGRWKVLLKHSNIFMLFLNICKYVLITANVERVFEV